MKLPNVDVSLSHGKLFNKKHFIPLYIALSTSCLFPVLTVFLLCLPAVEWDNDMIVALTLGNLFAAAIISLFVYVERKNRKLKNKISVWSTDAVKIRAYSKKVGEIRLGMQPKATKIQVRFTLNAVEYIRESTYKVLGGLEGYVGCFNQYADRAVTVLYSPKYDEVMILKDAQA